MSCIGAGTYFVDAYKHDLAPDSAIFNAVEGLINLDAAVNNFDLKKPNFKNINLGAVVQNEADAELEALPAFNPGKAPLARFDLPSLSGASYRALMSVIDFTHSSPVVPQIQYQEGEDGLPIPKLTISPPPLDYPQEALLDLPAAPNVQPVAAPELQIGEKPELKRIQRIDYDLKPIDPLDLSDLGIDYTPPDISELEWRDEIKYETDADLRKKLEELMQGQDEVGRWLSGLVQERLYASNIRPLSLKTKQEIDAIFADAAARGISMPTGEVEAKVEQVAKRELEESYKQAIAVRDEVYQASINAVTEAVQRSIAVERYHFKLYVRYVRQNLEVYKLNLQLATKAYNALVEVFNTLLRIVTTKVDAYNLFVAAVVAQSQALGDQARLSQAEVDTYRARVDMFRADVRVLNAVADVQQIDAKQQTLPLEEYEATLRGTLANLEIVKQNVAAYREAVNAYADATNWYQGALQAYEASIDASASKVAVGQANFDAYRQLWGAEKDRISAYEKYVSESLSLHRAELERYREAVGSQRRYLSALNQVVEASASAIASYATVARAQQSYVSDYNNASIGYTAAQDSTNISIALTEMAQQGIDAEAVAAEAKLDAAKRSVDLRAAGALSQVASTIFQVNLSASGSAAERVSGQDSGSTRIGLRQSKSWSKQCLEQVRAPTG